MEKTARINEAGKEPGKGREKSKVNFIRFFEKFWKMLFLLVSGVMMVLANKIYLFHTLQQFKDVKKGNLLNLTFYSIPFAFLYIGTDYLIHHIFDPWVDTHFLREDKYKDDLSRKKKSRVVVRWGFNIFYYSFTSVAGYLLIKDTSFMPPFLGGHGSIYSLSDNRYLEDATWGMEVFYYVQFGKHVGRYFCHAFIQPEGSYYEYLLHHSLATFLILFAYAMDMWLIGIFVLIAHDCSDVFLAFNRLYREYRHRKQSILRLGYVMTVISWIGLRIISFGYCCVWASWYQLLFQTQHLTQIQHQVFYFAYAFMCFMLSCLLLMHIYWTYFIIESFISSNVSEKLARHSYD